jgi:excisionase family DNA binding protein
MFLSVRQAAARLGVTPSRLGVLIRQGRIRALRVDTFWILREDDVDTFERLPSGYVGHLKLKKRKR